MLGNTLSSGAVPLMIVMVSHFGKIRQKYPSSHGQILVIQPGVISR